MSTLAEKLQNAVLSRDADEIESVLVEMYKSGPKHEFVTQLNQLLTLDCHQRHEDIVQTLQELKDPSSVDVLYRTALKTFEYLDYDECFGLARKCTWALADIGTPEAKEKLCELSKSDNSFIAGNALKRLENWSKELSRKAYNPT